MDLTYLAPEDRLRLSLRGQADWLFTRCLLLKLLPAWVDKLQSIDLPSVGVPLGPRDLGQEHALLEMLAQKARAVGWLDAVQLPPWLGASS